MTLLELAESMRENAQNSETGRSVPIKTIRVIGEYLDITFANDLRCRFKFRDTQLTDISNEELPF